MPRVRGSIWSGGERTIFAIFCLAVAVPLVWGGLAAWAGVADARADARAIERGSCSTVPAPCLVEERGVLVERQVRSGRGLVPQFRIQLDADDPVLSTDGPGEDTLSQYVGKVVTVEEQAGRALQVVVAPGGAPIASRVVGRAGVHNAVSTALVWWWPLVAVALGLAGAVRGRSARERWWVGTAAVEAVLGVACFTAHDGGGVLEFFLLAILSAVAAAMNEVRYWVRSPAFNPPWRRLRLRRRPARR